MIDFSKYRWIIIATAHCFLYFLASQLNHYMAPTSLNANILGTFAAFSGLCLGYLPGIASLMPVALIFDSRSPLEFGTGFVLAVLVFSLVYLARHQFRKESQIAGAIVSLAANALIFTGITLFATSLNDYSVANFSHILANLIWSSLVVLFLSKYYFDFLYSLLDLFGIHLAEEQRSIR